LFQEIALPHFVFPSAIAPIPTPLYAFAMFRSDSSKRRSWLLWQTLGMVEVRISISRASSSEKMAAVVQDYLNKVVVTLSGNHYRSLLHTRYRNLDVTI
jgi:hypothetical protein